MQYQLNNKRGLADDDDHDPAVVTCRSRDHLFHFNKLLGFSNNRINPLSAAHRAQTERTLVACPAYANLNTYFGFDTFEARGLIFGRFEIGTIEKFCRIEAFFNVLEMMCAYGGSPSFVDELREMFGWHVLNPFMEDGRKN